MQRNKPMDGNQLSKELPIRRLPPTGSLEAFVAAARAGSLRRASIDLNLSVSALSRRVQKLEQHTGRPLFLRKGNEYRLNEEGRRLLARIEKPYDEITAAFDMRGRVDRKGLTVGVPTSFATAWLIPRLDDFRKRNPDIELRLYTSGSTLEKLGECLDMIVFFAEEDRETVDFEVLRPQGAFLVARDGLVDRRDGLRKALRDTPLLVHRHLPHILENWLSDLGLPADIDLNIDYFDDGPLLIAAARSGLGLALVLEDMVKFYGDSGGLVRPFGEYVRTSFSYAIAARPAGGSVHAIERFRSWIVEETRKECELSLPAKMLEAS